MNITLAVEKLGAARAEGELVEYLRQVYGTFFLNADDKYLERT